MGRFVIIVKGFQRFLDVATVLDPLLIINIDSINADSIIRKFIKVYQKVFNPQWKLEESCHLQRIYEKISLTELHKINHY